MKKEFYHWFEEIDFFPPLKNVFLAIIVSKDKRGGKIVYLEPEFKPLEDNQDATRDAHL